MCLGTNAINLLFLFPDENVTMMWPELSALSLLLLAYLSSQFVGGTKTRHRLSAGGSHLRFHKRACGLTVWREMSNGQDAQAAYLGLWSMHKLKPDSVSEVSDMRSNLSGISFDYGEIKNGSMPFSSNLSALMVPFRTELHFASIQGMISLAQEPGTIRMGTELHEKQEINVSPGQVEFLIKICHLPWHHLHRDLGDYIDLKFKVKDRSLHQVIYPGELEARTPRFQMGWTSDTGYIDLASRVRMHLHFPCTSEVDVICNRPIRRAFLVQYGSCTHLPLPPQLSWAWGNIVLSNHRATRYELKWNLGQNWLTSIHYADQAIAGVKLAVSCKQVWPEMSCRFFKSCVLLWTYLSINYITLHHFNKWSAWSADSEVMDTLLMTLLKLAKIFATEDMNK